MEKHAGGGGAKVAPAGGGDDDDGEEAYQMPGGGRRALGNRIGTAIRDMSLARRAKYGGSLAATTSAHAPPTENASLVAAATPGSAAQGLGRQRCGSSGGQQAMGTWQCRPGSS